MANTTANVTAGKPAVGGAIFFAPAGTTLPTSATATLGVDFVSMGYISEDGLSNDNSVDVTEIKAWGGDTVLTQTEKTDNFKFTMIEALNADVLKRIFGSSNVTVATAGDITVNATTDDMEEGIWVFDMVLTGSKVKRIIIPKGRITEVGEIVYKDNDVAGYEVTVTALAVSGKTHIEYIA